MLLLDLIWKLLAVAIERTNKVAKKDIEKTMSIIASV